MRCMFPLEKPCGSPRVAKRGSTVRVKHDPASRDCWRECSSCEGGTCDNEETCYSGPMKDRAAGTNDTGGMRGAIVHGGTYATCLIRLINPLGKEEHGCPVSTASCQWFFKRR